MISDSRTWFAIAIDPVKLEYVVYGMVAEKYWTINSHAAMLLNHKSQLPMGNMIKPIQADKQLFNTRDNDKGDGFTSNDKTYERLGLKLHKAESQKALIEQGVSHINNIAAEGMLEVMLPYSDENLNQGMIVQGKAIEELKQYRRKEDGSLPIRKGADIPDTLRYNIGPLPSDRTMLRKMISNSFTQDFKTGIIMEINNKKSISQMNGSIVFSSPLKKNVKLKVEGDEDFKKFSPFGM